MWGHSGTITVSVIGLCWISGNRAIPIPPSTPGLDAYFSLVVRNRVGDFISYFITNGDTYMKGYKVWDTLSPLEFILGERYFPDVEELAMAREAIANYLRDLDIA